MNDIESMRQAVADFHEIVEKAKAAGERLREKVLRFRDIKHVEAILKQEGIQATITDPRGAGSPEIKARFADENGEPPKGSRLWHAEQELRKTRAIAHAARLFLQAVKESRSRDAPAVINRLAALQDAVEANPKPVDIKQASSPKDR